MAGEDGAEGPKEEGPRLKELRGMPASCPLLRRVFASAAKPEAAEPAEVTEVRASLALSPSPKSAAPPPSSEARGGGGGRRRWGVGAGDLASATGLNGLPLVPGVSLTSWSGVRGSGRCGVAAGVRSAGVGGSGRGGLRACGPEERRGGSSGLEGASYRKGLQWAARGKATKRLDVGTKTASISVPLKKRRYASEGGMSRWGHDGGSQGDKGAIHL